MLRSFAFIFFLFQCYASFSSDASSISTSSSLEISKDYALFNRGLGVSSNHLSYPFNSKIFNLEDLYLSALREISSNPKLDIILLRDPKTFPKNIFIEQQSETILEGITCKTEISIFLNEMLTMAFKRKDSNNDIIRIYFDNENEIHILKYSYKNFNPSTLPKGKKKKLIKNQKEEFTDVSSLSESSLSLPAINLYNISNLESEINSPNVSRTVLTKKLDHTHECSMDNLEICPAIRIMETKLSTKFLNVFAREIIENKPNGKRFKINLRNETFANDLVELLAKNLSKRPRAFEQMIIPENLNISQREFSSETIISEVLIDGEDILVNALFIITGLLNPFRVIQMISSDEGLWIACHDFSKLLKSFSSSIDTPINSTPHFRSSSPSSSMASSLSLSSNSSSSHEITTSQPYSDNLETKFLIFKNEYPNKYSSNMKSFPIMNIYEILLGIPFDEKFDFLIIKDQESISTDISIKDYDGISLEIEASSTEVNSTIFWMMTLLSSNNDQISNSLIRVYRDQDRIQILKYKYENSKLSDSKSKESRIKGINMTIPPPSKTIFIQNLLEMNANAIDPLKILNSISLSTASHSLNLLEMKFLNFSDSTEKSLNIYKIVSKEKSLDIELFKSSNHNDHYSTISSFIKHFLTENDSKAMSFGYVIIPKDFYEKNTDGNIILSKSLIVGKCNLDKYLFALITTNFVNSNIVRLTKSSNGIQISFYSLATKEIEIDNKVTFTDSFTETSISTLNEGIEKLTIKEKGKRKDGRTRREKLKEKKNKKNKQISKEQSKQEKESLKIKEKEKEEFNKKKNEKSNQQNGQSEKLESDSLGKKKLSEKSSNPSPSKADSSVKKPSQSESSESQKRKPVKKPVKKPKPTSRQRIRAQVNQERLANKNKKTGKKFNGNGGRSKSSNKKSVKGGDESFNSFPYSSGSSRGIKPPKIESPDIKPLSKQAEPTINTGKLGKFGAKHVPLWRKKSSDSNSTDEQEEISPIESRKKYPEMSKDEQENEKFLKEALIDLSIKSDEPTVTETCSSSSSTLSSLSSSSLSKKVEFHQKIMEKNKRDSKKNKGALNKFLGNKNAFGKIKFRNDNSSGDGEGGLSEIDFEANEMSDEEYINFLCDIASQSKDQK